MHSNLSVLIRTMPNWITSESPTTQAQREVTHRWPQILPGGKAVDRRSGYHFRVPSGYQSSYSGKLQHIRKGQETQTLCQNIGG
jgi:hypothetical protein